MVGLWQRGGGPHGDLEEVAKGESHARWSAALLKREAILDLRTAAKPQGPILLGWTEGSSLMVLTCWKYSLKASHFLAQNVSSLNSIQVFSITQLVFPFVFKKKKELNLVNSWLACSVFHFECILLDLAKFLLFLELLALQRLRLISAVLVC